MSCLREKVRERLRLYFVSPDGWGAAKGDDERLVRLIQAGVGVVQFRDKSDLPDRERRAAQMREVCAAAGAIFLVNDDPSLALRLQADGVHVGVTDAAVAEARRLLGPEKIIGATARSLERAEQALREGADYLGVGAIYDASASKPDALTGGLALLSMMRGDARTAAAPMVAIGGIRPDNALPCLEAGADGVAMIRGLWQLEEPETALAALRAWKR